MTEATIKLNSRIPTVVFPDGSTKEFPSSEAAIRHCLNAHIAWRLEY